jgi:hypothetical protein
VPCDHFEWQPPQISAENRSWSVGLIVKTREPESSAALKMAPQTLHGSSRSNRRCLRESVGVFIRSVYSVRSRRRDAPSAGGSWASGAGMCGVQECTRLRRRRRIADRRIARSASPLSRQPPDIADTPFERAAAQAAFALVCSRRRQDDTSSSITQRKRTRRNVTMSWGSRTRAPSCAVQSACTHERLLRAPQGSPPAWSDNELATVPRPPPGRRPR